MPEPRWDIETALEYILSAQYGKDVRQAIHDAIHACFDEGGAGSTDLQAREIATRALNTVAGAVNDMMINSGRVVLLPETILNSANQTVTLAKAIAEFDNVWLHIEDVGAGQAGNIILANTNYVFPIDLPCFTETQSSCDVFINGITQNSAFVKYVGEYKATRVFGDTGADKQWFEVDEIRLPTQDSVGNMLNLSTRSLKFSGLNGAKVTVVGYGAKASDSGSSTGFILDSSHIVHCAGGE